ncbi:MAG: 5'/3'-nucleotidase SurE [Clostridia bacterium]|nr:5'/3'-nucleotidase SurE [Clostridia bacterium]
MRILITNDDGIASPILPILARRAEELGEVTVIAPKVEQSGKSHAIDFTRPIEIKRVDIGEGIRAYSMDSTPADCVRFAVCGLKEHFDLVISGVNRGFNLGKDIVYSGTIGAIFEAARLGIKGVALSTDPRTFAAAEEKLDTVLEFFIKHRLLDRNTIYNVNIPLDDEGVLVTRQGGIYFTDDFVHRDGDIYVQVGEMAKNDSTDLRLDTVAVINNYISITPLISEKTNVPLFEELSEEVKR